MPRWRSLCVATIYHFPGRWVRNTRCPIRTMTIQEACIQLLTYFSLLQHSDEKREEPMVPILLSETPLRGVQKDSRRTRRRISFSKTLATTNPSVHSIKPVAHLLVFSHVRAQVAAEDIKAGLDYSLLSIEPTRHPPRSL